MVYNNNKNIGVIDDFLEKSYFCCNLYIIYIQKEQIREREKRVPNI